MSLNKKNDRTVKEEEAEGIEEETKMQSKSVYLPVSYWKQLEEIRKNDKTRTNTKVIREAGARDACYDKRVCEICAKLLRTPTPHARAR